jgi:hypothetical protein
MNEAAYDRIAAAIKRSRGSQLIAVVVPVTIPLLTVTRRLQSSLLRRGVDARCFRIRGHADVLEPIETELGSDTPGAIVIHGLEAMPAIERESFLRATSFARSRLRRIPVPIVLVLGEETWSWLGLELPDLARWMDGPFAMAGDDGTGVVGPLHVGSWRELLLRAPALLDEHRNVDVDRSIDAWIDRGGVLAVGGPPGVGITGIAMHIRTRLAAMGKPTSWTNEARCKPLRLDDWLERHRGDIVIIDRELSDSAQAAVQRRGMSGVVLGSTRMALESPGKGVTQLYVPPVQVVEADGGPHPAGIAVMVRRIRFEVELQLGVDIDSLLTIEQLETFGHACGGLPGLMWRLVAHAEHRSRRLGLPSADAELVRAVIIDTAKTSIAPVAEEDVERAVHHDLLDFELEARGAVLFYVIDGRLRTLRHPLLTLASRMQADAGEHDRRPGL